MELRREAQERVGTRPLSNHLPTAMQEHQIGVTTVRLLRGDITEQAVDAIANAANSSLMGGGGVDGAIHRRGGPAILEACREIRRTRFPDGLPTGEAVATTAGALPARYIIHTVGPVWRGGHAQEHEQLAQAYRNVLATAAELGARTIALPSISTGVYGFPVEQAAPIALRSARAMVHARPAAFAELRFVLFSDDDLRHYADAWARVSTGAS